MAHPEWRRSVCGNCQGDWHRDRAAATSILNRGEVVLRGAALPPSILNGLLEAAKWRPDESPGPTGAPVKGELKLMGELRVASPGEDSATARIAAGREQARPGMVVESWPEAPANK